MHPPLVMRSLVFSLILALAPGANAEVVFERVVAGLDSPVAITHAGDSADFNDGSIYHIVDTTPATARRRSVAF